MKVITFEDAGKYLLNPFVSGQLKLAGLNDISQLLYNACELEDVQEMIPHKFELSLLQFKNSLINELDGKTENIS